MKTDKLIIAGGKDLPGKGRRFLEATVKPEGFSPAKYSAMELCLTEHIENVIRHGYKGKKGEVSITATTDFPEVSVTVKDSGPAFDMRKKKLPDISKRIKKGLGGKMGIRTILSVCDRASYCRVKGKNVNTFYFKDGGQ